MTDEASTTGVLKKISPFWWWVRGNPSLILVMCGMALGSLYSWHDLKTRIRAVEIKVDAIPTQPVMSHDDYVELKKGFAELQKDDAYMMLRWCQVDAGRKGGHRANCSP